MSSFSTRVCFFDVVYLREFIGTSASPTLREECAVYVIKRIAQATWTHLVHNSFIHTLIQLFVRSFVRSFLPSFLHSFPPSLTPSLLACLLPSFLPNFLPSELPSFLPNFPPSFWTSFLLPFLHSFIHSSVYMDRSSFPPSFLSKSYQTFKGMASQTSFIFSVAMVTRRLSHFWVEFTLHCGCSLECYWWHP